MMWLAMDASFVNEFQSLIGILSEIKKCSNLVKFGAPSVEMSSEYLKLMKSKSHKRKHWA